VKADYEGARKRRPRTAAYELRMWLLIHITTGWTMFAFIPAFISHHDQNFNSHEFSFKAYILIVAIGSKITSRCVDSDTPPTGSPRALSWFGLPSPSYGSLVTASQCALL
jgi:hypothetical protein